MHTYIYTPTIPTYSYPIYPLSLLVSPSYHRTHLYLDHPFYLFLQLCCLWNLSLYCEMLVKPHTKRYNSPILEILVYFCHLIHFISLCLYHHTIPYIMKDTLSHFLHFSSFRAIHALSMHYPLLFDLVSWYCLLFHSWQHLSILVSQYLSISFYYNEVVSLSLFPILFT